MDYNSYVPIGKISQKHMLTLLDYSREDIYEIISLALDLKKKRLVGAPHRYLEGKKLAMIFTKSSTRTRVSFETGMYELGGYALFLSSADIQLRRGETIGDTARVLSRMVDGIMIRTFDQRDVVDLAKYGTVPVINGLTDDYHPCQVLADLMTYYERKGSLSGKLCYIGDGNNMANSLMIGCAKVGMDFAAASPDGYCVKPDLVEKCRAIASKTGSSITITDDPFEAASGAGAVYTDVWASMGMEDEANERLKAFAGYQVSAEVFNAAREDAIFLHCLPAHRGEEVAAEVIDGPRSAVFDEAENRLHAQKALMALLMGESKWTE